MYHHMQDTEAETWKRAHPVMKIRVEQSDIDAGIPQDSCSCPVGIAISRALGGVIVFVMVSAVVIDPEWPEERALPEHVGRWIVEFDHEKKVSPIEFELEIG